MDHLIWDKKQHRHKDREKINEEARLRKKIQRHKAIYKLARLGLGRDAEGEPACSHCGCPHIPTLDIGHINDDGKEHRKEVGSIISWVLKTTVKRIIDWNIRLECIYCNQFKGRTGRYPQSHETPQWWLTAKEE